MNPSAPSSDPRALLAELERSAQKRFGQHFLARPDIIARIVRLAGVKPGDRVLEIGPGLGVLTEALLAAGAEVVAVEVDRVLAAFLRGRFPTLRLVEADATQVDWGELLGASTPPGAWKMVANLPYNVGTPIVMEAAKRPDVFHSLTVMLQAEVVDRMAAGAADEAYGAMSLLLQARAEVRTLFSVPPSAFVPPPKVSSSVVQAVLRAEPAVGPGGVTAFERVVRGAFAQRRKTLRNALGAALGYAEAERILAEAGIAPGERAERVDAKGFCALAEALRRGATGLASSAEEG
jgi:16S rRNA (adenine1518-N6/adenine1519-N6)-dimethyltransferase